MKQLMYVLIVVALFFTSCNKEKQKVPEQKQETVMPKEEAKTRERLLSESKSKLNKAKILLEQEGKYDCCIEDGCNYCALHEASCPCHEELKKGEHVCIECYAGWQQGKGDVPNVKKEDVKTSFVKHEHKH